VGVFLVFEKMGSHSSLNIPGEETNDKIRTKSSADRVTTAG
jgi:hypothetical protein